MSALPRLNLRATWQARADDHQAAEASRDRWDRLLARMMTMATRVVIGLWLLLAAHVFGSLVLDAVATGAEAAVTARALGAW